MPFDDGRATHVAALRVAILQVLEGYQGERPQPAVTPPDQLRLAAMNVETGDVDDDLD